ncbi:siderophore-interacting protein [Corynebacterium lowii]|uniref:NADPH-dependent ferric-chelate reductase n=1 Tax=Corynebacterium lowii TaxID=1544413 RepID=A0A0Q1E410_9CORY|nr:siderophore-interacting protein [Corynebacterium lowii]KQB87494.1 NADPH-dependent ferric-chelate reductase [Corynebacterium lowii]MDP9851911.1 NADPH-dependent ferric siderophore reductase [Corynebacterium lowii]
MSYIVTRVQVMEAQRLSPHWARITLGGPGMREVGTPASPVYDQRIKVLVPRTPHPLPPLEGSTEWYRDWLALPEAQRGDLRTYSIRHITPGLSLTVDFVLHLTGDATGPAAQWAASAQPGDEVLIVAPRRGPEDTAGIAFHPGRSLEVTLCGDETAAPAIARILEDVRAHLPHLCVRAYIEVPTKADCLAIDAAPNATVEWLPREGAPLGSLLEAALRAHMSEHGGVDKHEPEALPAVSTAEVLWEVPEEAGAGEYYWIAGESGVVRGLRRYLMREAGVARSQVAFMGYWRRGVAMV